MCRRSLYLVSWIHFGRLIKVCALVVRAAICEYMVCSNVRIIRKLVCFHGNMAFFSHRSSLSPCLVASARADQARIPVMSVVGKKEVDDGTLAVRTRGAGDIGVVNVEELLAKMVEADAAACELHEVLEAKPAAALQVVEEIEAEQV